MASVQDTRQDLPLGEGAPACRGERGRRDAMIHSDISGEMVHCANLPQNLCKTAANRSPLQPRYARQLISIGIIATGNDCDLRFAARRTAPREAFGSCVTAYHSTYPVRSPTWAGRLIASPTGAVLKRTCFHRKNVTGWAGALAEYVLSPCGTEKPGGLGHLLDP